MLEIKPLIRQGEMIVAALSSMSEKFFTDTMHTL